jgi:hypothetical protein
VPDALRDEARKVLAWEDIFDEKGDLRLDDAQSRQLDESVSRARRDVKEAVWRTYKNLMLLGKGGTWKAIDLGLVHSSSSPSLTELILERLRQEGDLEATISPNFLERNWPPAFREWSTKSVRDAFFASPQFPRLLNPDGLKDTIIRGVENGMLGYVGKKSDGSYDPFHWKSSLSILDVEISEEAFIIKKEIAEAYITGKTIPAAAPEIHFPTDTTEVLPTGVQPSPASPSQPLGATSSGFARITWKGDVPPQKWMNFYTKVLAKFATQPGLKIGLNIEIAPQGGISAQSLDEIKLALRELGLQDDAQSE